MKRKKYYSSTPYDDVFKTLLVNLPETLIGLVNEMFNCNYDGNEKVKYSNNELFIYTDDNKTKRITDSSFYIIKENIEKHYHIECQSNKDNSMLIRMYEYGSQLALQNKSFINSDTLVVNYPKTGILYLRSDKSIPDKMNIVLNIPDGSLHYKIDVLKIKNYTIDTIFKKKLYFFIPFYIFRFDDDLESINNDGLKLTVLKSKIIQLISKLNKELNKKSINEYTYMTIINMMKNVVESYTRKYNNINQEVLDIMGGNVIEYEFDTAYKKGISEGIEQGIEHGKVLGMRELLDTIIAAGGLDEATAKKYLQDLNEKDK